MMDTATAHNLWNELHMQSERLKVDLDQERFFANWFNKVKSALGCTSCWKKIEWFCQRWPVLYGSCFWLWSICLHDYVNKELGKPLFYPNLTLAPLTQKGMIQ